MSKAEQLREDAQKLQEKAGALYDQADKVEEEEASTKVVQGWASYRTFGGMRVNTREVGDSGSWPVFICPDELWQKIKQVVGVTLLDEMQL